MVFTYFSPEWFRGIDVVLEFSYCMVALIISLFSYKMYKESLERNVKLFSLAFLLISISYFIQTLINVIIISKITSTNMHMMMYDITFQSISLFESIGLISHIIFITLGFSILTYITFKTKSIKPLLLIILLSLSSILLSSNSLYMFYLISTIYLIFISHHFIKNYIKNKKVETLLVAIAFLFLLFGNFHFIISVNHQLYYAIGHILEFFAYILIFTNLYLVYNKK